MKIVYTKHSPNGLTVFDMRIESDYDQEIRERKFNFHAVVEFFLTSNISIFNLWFAIAFCSFKPQNYLSGDFNANFLADNTFDGRRFDCVDGYAGRNFP